MSINHKYLAALNASLTFASDASESRTIGATFYDTACSALYRVVADDLGISDDDNNGDYVFNVLTADDDKSAGAFERVSNDALADLLEGITARLGNIPTADSKAAISKAKKQHEGVKCRVKRTLADARMLFGTEVSDKGAFHVELLAGNESIVRHYKAVTKVTKPSKEEVAKEAKEAEEALEAAAYQDGFAVGRAADTDANIGARIAAIIDAVDAMSVAVWKDNAEDFAALFLALKVKTAAMKKSDAPVESLTATA